MRLASFVGENGPTFGLHTERGLFDLAPFDAEVRNLVDLIAAGPAALDAARDFASRADGPRFVEPENTEFLPAVVQPGKFVCLGLNFKDHAAEGGFDVPAYPAMFLRANTSLVGAGAPLVRPKASETFDYEAELAVVIGSRVRHVARREALDAVFGYTVFNDASVREYQRKTQQWTAGKNFDGTGALGPFIVTKDALPDGARGLRITSRLNGEVLQDSSTDDMIFSVADVVSILSEIMTLEPGDVIAMGTPAGVGHARRPQLWMKPGDVCEVEIEGIGLLSNPVVDETASKQGADQAA